MLTRGENYGPSVRVEGKAGAGGVAGVLGGESLLFLYLLFCAFSFKAREWRS